MFLRKISGLRLMHKSRMFEIPSFEGRDNIRATPARIQTAEAVSRSALGLLDIGRGAAVLGLRRMARGTRERLWPNRWSSEISRISRPIRSRFGNDSPLRGDVGLGVSNQQEKLGDTRRHTGSLERIRFNFSSASESLLWSRPQSHRKSESLPQTTLRGGGVVSAIRVLANLKGEPRFCQEGLTLLRLDGVSPGKLPRVVHSVFA